MLCKKIVVIAVSVSFFSGTTFAFNWDFLFKRNTVAETASLLGTLWHGVEVGGATGLSAGWARYSGNNDQQNVWSSTGWGALAGAGFGAAAELIGQGNEGNIILSDIGYGGKLGGSAGALAGTVAGLLTGKSELVGESTAWGVIAGSVLSLGYSGYRIATGKKSGENNQKGLPVPKVLGIAPSVSFNVLMVTIEKRF